MVIYATWESSTDREDKDLKTKMSNSVKILAVSISFKF